MNDKLTITPLGPHGERPNRHHTETGLTHIAAQADVPTSHGERQ
ncbi:hypothetical protein [Aeromonas tecta]|nr:hypothetical protein [Aeromonas tecta]